MFPEIGEIERTRRKLGLTQKELARMAGVSQSLIAKVESGRLNPSYSAVKRIFETLQSLEKQTEAMARDILSPDIVSVNKDDSISKAMRLMEEKGYSQLPVFEGDQVVGSINEKIILDILIGGEDPSRMLKQPVELVMEEPFPRIDEKTSIAVVSTLLRYNQAILVTRRERCVGIITKTDLFKVVPRQ